MNALPRRCLFLTASLVFSATTDVAHASLSHPRATPADVIVLDVDNTLYSEESLRSQAGCSSRLGIEEQIVRNIHAYCQDNLSLNKDQADELHHMFGSTIEGLRHTLGQDLTARKMATKLKHCYENIYDGFDYSSLLNLHQAQSHQQSTGYSHQGDEIAQLRDLLETQSIPLYLASNSPSWHVKKVIQALGLMNIPWKGVVSPDQDRESVLVKGSSDTSKSKYHVYPTKYSPSLFYQSILNINKNGQSTKSKIVLLDDSKRNIESLPKQLVQGIHVNKDHPLVPALMEAMGVIDSPQVLPVEDYTYVDDEDHHVDHKEKREKSERSYQFSQVEYLKSKNVVDAMALHRPTWLKVAQELKMILRESTGEELHIVDVGAGILSMLKLIVQGDESLALPSLLSLVLEDTVSDTVLFRRIRYFAYESNDLLQSECTKILEQMGFERRMADESDNEYVFASSADALQSHEVIVHLRLVDYNENVKLPHKPDPQLIVGCCFADLMEPYHLASSLIRRFLSNTPGSSSTNNTADCLCYFPITFSGITQFIPPQPFEIRKTGSIPSDTTAFALYSQALEGHHKHNLDPHLLIKAMKAFGASVISYGPADWDIDPRHHPYFWETMLYFFERVAGPELLKNGWDAAGWLRRARQDGKGKGRTKEKGKRHSPSILVSNLDLLFKMPRLGCIEIPAVPDSSNLGDGTVEEEGYGIEEIQFTAPHKVSCVRKIIGTELEPNQVRIKSVCSLISSGTELKVFKGLFDDAALDVNIKGMDEERMAYPLAYGYSLVGRVVQCGPGVEDADELIGKLVFTFSAHASHVIADRDAIQLVPVGIDAQDAIFMPSVETAISIVHDAHVRLGENVAVFGQGLIGLLVTAILCRSQQHAMDLDAPCSSSFGSKLGTVTTFDAIPSRLAASAAMGASQALLPTEIQASGPFDVAIEVSGNSRALQSAIDHTRNHGRLVIASWYGNEDVALKLGIEFHRSHKSIITSQVSEIKAALSGLWSKERRFALTWELVKSIKPSRLITKRATLSGAQEAYEALDRGIEVAIAFDYKHSQ